jgi:hypothetical protein
MIDSVRRRCKGSLLAIALYAALTSSCRPAKPPDYEDPTGLHFAPPPGWVERARAGVEAGPAHREPNLPLPHLDTRQKERLLVRYDRLTAGYLAWMRLSVALVPAATTLEACLTSRAPARDWRRQGDIESLQVHGKPAARAAWKGTWLKQDYLCETTAVRRGEEVYFFTASWPADDPSAREQVRQSVADAVLP